MAKVFIAGGAGFIGYHLTKKFLDEGHEVIIYDALVNYIAPHESVYNHYLQKRLQDIQNRVRFVRGNVCETDFLISALKEHAPDVVVVLAAVPIATACNQFSKGAMDSNLLGTVALLEAIQKTPSVKRLVYTSSSFVYGNFQYDPADEEHPTNPIDVYGATKLAGEYLVKGFGNRFGIEYVIIRPSAVYGPTDANRRVSQIFVENALKGKPLKLEGGGETRIDFSYVTDVASGFALAALKPEAANNVFNITAGQGRSLKEFAEILKTLIPDLVVMVTPPDLNNPRPNRGSLDISKAREILGYEPKFQLEDGLREYVAYAREHFPNL